MISKPDFGMYFRQKVDFQTDSDKDVCFGRIPKDDHKGNVLQCKQSGLEIKYQPPHLEKCDNKYALWTPLLANFQHTHTHFAVFWASYT